MSVNTWGAVNTWDGGGAPPSVAVGFSGLISNRTIAIGGSLSLSLSGNFSGTETPFTYSLLSGVLPTGLTLNASTGAVSGTPSVLGLSSGIVVRATDTALSTADTNSFSINVVDGVVVPVDERLTQSSIAAYLRTQGFTGGNNDVIIAWLKSEGFEAEYNDAFNNYLGSLGYIGGFTDKYAAWQKEAGV